MKYACWTLSALFGLFAALQFNDPDPAAWIAVYGTAAIVWAALGLRRLEYWIPIVVGLVCSVWMISLRSALSALFESGDPSALFTTPRMDAPYIEESREFLGLLIVVVSMAFAAAVAYRRRSS